MFKALNLDLHMSNADPRLSSFSFTPLPPPCYTPPSAFLPKRTEYILVWNLLEKF